ncbi:MAG: hypothetical protein QXQ69_03250 [Candidatus Aenigmatarchaeota archaeon]
MEEREKLVSEVKSALDRIERKNSYKVKGKDLKEIFNYLLRIKDSIEASNLPKEEKNVYKSRIYQVLKCNQYNLEKASEQVARKGLKDVCFCLKEIAVTLEKNSYVKVKSTSK